MAKAMKINWLEVARLALLSRRLDRLEVEQLTPQGKVKYQFSSSGHELAQILLAQALDHAHDAAAVYYRSRPFMLACGLTAEEALAAGMARTNSPSQGRDVGVVYNMPHRQGLTVLPASGDVGAQYTPAAGWAQAITYRVEVLEQEDWSGALAVALGGDGSVAANGFWAALNIATTLNLPLLFFIEDNHYGLSVPAELQVPGGSITRNLKSYGNLKVLDGDGTAPLQAWEKIRTAIRHVRARHGPCLLRLQVPRLEGHTFIDDQAYKSQEERAQEAERDPIERLHTFLVSQGTAEDTWQELVEQVEQELMGALQAAESCPQPDPERVQRDVFFEGSAAQQGGLRPEGAMLPLKQAPAQESGPRVNLVDAVRRTLELEMTQNARMLVFGEDVGVKGGVHGATLDMQSHFGERRVFDTSLSEEGIIGRACGLALAGLLPVPEIQFRKYADPAHEQISDLGTIRWRTANNFAAPVVVRMPVGFGKVTGDPWHSVTSEAPYAHLPGWRIAFPSNARDAVGLLRTALRGDDPILFLEHRALLDTRDGRRPYPGDDFSLPFGKAAILKQGSELTVITWGAMVARCLEASLAFPERVSIIDLRTIVPWDKATVLESVQRTGKVLIVHEDRQTAGFAGEIIAVIAAESFMDLDAPLRRLTMADIPVPFNANLMNAVLPNTARIRAEMEALLAF
ncbi:MAG: thiamine pyrophosphate-dependent enzyme [Anaerolineales bacterium]